MKTLFLHLLAAAATAGLVQGQFVCDIPTSGCTNGMFNQALCECECISPFCPGINGDCVNPSNSCGGNKWTQCTRGVNCPWWQNALKAESCTTGPDVPLGLWEIYSTEKACCNTNFAYSEFCDVRADSEGTPTKHPTILAPEDDDVEVVPIKFDVAGNCPWWQNALKAESCTTGPDVPLGLWEIYSTRKACCNTNFAYSEYCDIKTGSTGPTKHPTIIAPDDDDFEVVPIKFDVAGLPDSISMRDLKDEMKTVLKRILLRLADRIPGLRITEIEEKVVLNRNLLKALRSLKRDVTLYFNVHVVRDDDKKFGPLIIAELRDSYSEVLDQIQTFSDTKYFGGDLNLNFCTSQSGKYELCVKEIFNPTAPSSPVVSQNDSGGGSGEGGDDGLPGWGIALIIIAVLLLLACLGYIIFLICFTDDYNDTKEINNNIYLEDEKSRASGYTSRRSPRSTRSGKTRSRQIVLAEPQDSKSDDGSFTINTHASKKTYASKQRQGRDPTMYIPGQEDKPDPDSADSDVLMLQDGESSRRYYLEDPPLRPKRDPTMYVAGNYASEDPPLKPKRDPTMYVEGQQDPSVYTDEASGAGYSAGRRASVESYSVGTYGIGGTINGEEEYDQYGFRHSERDAEYMTSETDAEYPRGVRDPSYYVQEESFRTQDASVSKSERPKKSKKSKKSTRSAR
eukprot:CAMPEP_0201901826 /NCGR_PEP_ID=MMETSP0902-20130614/54634_1 /ASSEMBLY_ACC=CAM_ASM_000551 /TAXON_ID=420261 /ORGANISM="Thalassiosira antarctica, Strain CCMP982" /LENGTH=679 /DNA_ID=CAMNT_0048435801 /DNA_START=52 /DNA_END=2092 /DNA_ORIENTATION=-